MWLWDKWKSWFSPKTQGGIPFSETQYGIPFSIKEQATVPFKVESSFLEPADYVSSPNHGLRFANLPDTIIIHYTAGPSLISAVNTFLDPKTRVSAHLIVDRNGKMVQCVPFDVIAWHAGKSEWEGRTGLNAYSIGIEMVNAGRLDEVENVEELRSWWGGLYHRSEALFALNRQKTYWSWWHSYTDVQIKAVEDLCQTLMKSYPICYILGHDEIAPGRKSDPGPTFPLDELKQFLRK